MLDGHGNREEADEQEIPVVPSDIQFFVISLSGQVKCVNDHF
jgi:hypothetical protein